jgi:glycosyltransferase involved in cell wall biosynthesis
MSRIGSPEPVLFIRGVAAQDAEALKNEIKTWSKEKVAFRLQEYTTDAVRVEQSFRRASGVLMPSRSEGFGLVGLEAIARGIPLLASSESGLAEVLLKHGGEAGQAAVVKISRDAEATIEDLGQPRRSVRAGAQAPRISGPVPE